MAFGRGGIAGINALCARPPRALMIRLSSTHGRGIELS